MLVGDPTSLSLLRRSSFGYEGWKLRRIKWDEQTRGEKEAVGLRQSYGG